MQNFGKVPEYIQHKLSNLRTARTRNEKREAQESAMKKTEQVYLLKSGKNKGKVLSRSEYHYLGSTEKEDLIKVSTLLHNFLWETTKRGISNL